MYCLRAFYCGRRTNWRTRQVRRQQAGQCQLYESVFSSSWCCSLRNPLLQKGDFFIVLAVKRFKQRIQHAVVNFAAFTVERIAVQQTSLRIVNDRANTAVRLIDAVAAAGQRFKQGCRANRLADVAVQPLVIPVSKTLPSLNASSPISAIMRPSSQV